MRYKMLEDIASPDETSCPQVIHRSFVFKGISKQDISRIENLEDILTECVKRAKNRCSVIQLQRNRSELMMIGSINGGHIMFHSYPKHETLIVHIILNHRWLFSIDSVFNTLYILLQPASHKVGKLSWEDEIIEC